MQSANGRQHAQWLSNCPLQSRTNPQCNNRAISQLLLIVDVERSLGTRLRVGNVQLRDER